MSPVQALVRYAVPLAAAALLSACAGGPPPQGAEPHDRAAPAPRPAVPGPVKSARPAVPPPRVGDIDGRSAEAVARVLGTPTLTRHEPPAEVWQYAGQGCVLDVVFYPGAEGTALRAEYLESRGLDGRGVATPDCLRRLAEEGRF